MSDRDDRLKVLIKGAADEAAEHHRPVDVVRIVAGRQRRRRRRSAKALPVRSVRRVAVAAFVLAAAIGIVVGVRSGSSVTPQRPAAGSTTTPFAALVREYPHPIAIAVSWVEGHEAGVYAAPTWLPPGGAAEVTPYVSVVAVPPPGVRSSWQLALVRGGDGLVTEWPVPKGGVVAAGFALTTYSSEAAAYRALSSITIRPAGSASTTTLGDGIVGYVHDAGATGPEVYWLEGSWQLLVGGATTSAAVRAAGALVAYLNFHPLPAGAGVLVASRHECRATQLFVDATATVTLPASCDATSLARVASSVQPAP